MTISILRIVRRLAFAGAIALAFAVGSVQAETVITGRMFDPQGKAVAGATVRLQIGRSELTHAVSDEQGRFRIAPDSSGSYRLTVQARGFQQNAEDITI